MKRFFEQASGDLDSLVEDFRDGAVSRREFIRRGAALGFMASSLAAIAAAPAAGQGAVKRGGKSIWSLPGNPVAINPIESPGGLTRDTIYDTVYESLFRYDKAFNLVPALAVKHENPNPTTWRFHLRQGVKFHHGRELDSEDIVFWHKNLFDPDIIAPHKTYFSNVKEVVALDKYTVEFRLSDPLGPLLRNFGQLFGASILPRDWRDAVPDLKLHAVGTGPFKVKEFKPPSHIVYVRHEDYWDDPLPYLDEVFLRILPDEETRIGGLRTGSLQYANLTPDGSRRLAGNKNVQVIRTQSSLVYTHMFNTRKPPFDDIRVRKAIDRAIDRETVIEKVAAGEGTLTGPVPTGMGKFYIPANELPYKRDLDEARSLLAAAGYANGFEATVITRTTIPQNIQSSVIMAEQVRPLGIKLNIEQLEGGVFSARGRAHDFNLMANIWSPRVDPDAYFGRTFLHKSNQNWMGWGYPEFDKLIFEARMHADEDKRVPFYRRIQERIMDEVPVIWWYQANIVEGLSSKLKGYWGSYLGRRSGMKDAWLDV